MWRKQKRGDGQSSSSRLTGRQQPTKIEVLDAVTNSIKKPGAYGGVYPMDAAGQWEKAAATLRQLPRLRERLRSLERQAAQGSDT